MKHCPSSLTASLVEVGHTLESYIFMFLKRASILRLKFPFITGIIAVVASTVLLVIFSEIIPQAVCSRHGLAIGAFFAWPVRILIYVLFIVAWPIAKVLDLLLGSQHGVLYRSAG